MSFLTPTQPSSVGCLIQCEHLATVNQAAGQVEAELSPMGVILISPKQKYQLAQYNRLYWGNGGSHRQMVRQAEALNQSIQ